MSIDALSRYEPLARNRPLTSGHCAKDRLCDGLKSVGLELSYAVWQRTGSGELVGTPDRRSVVLSRWPDGMANFQCPGFGCGNATVGSWRANPNSGRRAAQRNVHSEVQ